MPKEQILRATGRAISENVNSQIPRGLLKRIPELQSVGFGTEVLYAFVIIAVSLIIYFSTREMYQLSKHKGIKYFRLAFLYFAIAYFFRTFILFIIRYLNIGRILDFSPRLFGPITMFIFMYASSMAILYLLYSLIHKKLGENKLILFHIIAIAISAVTVFTRNIGILLWIQILLMLLVIIIGYQSYKKSDKNKSLYIIYILLFIFWMLNILDIIIPDFFRLTKLFIYLVSVGLFLIILHKVSRKTV